MAKRLTMIEGFWDRFEECILETDDAKATIARNIGCSRHVIQRNQCGVMPNTIYIARFCALYGFSSDYLFGISKEKYNGRKPAKIEDFWDRFEECSAEVGHSKTVIAKRIGCERKTLYAPKEKERIPSSLYVARFCVIYNYTADYLLGVTGKKAVAA